MQSIKFACMLLVGAATIAMSANSAQAFSVSLGGTEVKGEGVKSSVEGAQTVDFNSGKAVSDFVTYSGITNNIVQGSVASKHAAPTGDNTSYLTIAKQGSTIPGATGSVVLNFAKAIDYFGIYWGSVDTHNKIDFFMGDKLIKTFGGGDVSSTAKGSWTSATDNIYVNFFADQGEWFDKIVLRAEGVAFESDNHAFRLDERASGAPEPLTIGGTLVGLAMGWRMKKKFQAVKAQ